MNNEFKGIFDSPSLDENGEFSVDIGIPEHVIISIDSHAVTVTRKGIRSFANRGQNGDQVIPLQSIIGVDFKKAGLTSGQINFVTSAGNQKTGGMGALPGFSGGAYNKANNVLFRSSHNEDIEFIKNFVESHMGQSPSSESLSVADEISKFKKLLDDGVITNEEFEAKKKQLLGL